MKRITFIIFIILSLSNNYAQNTPISITTLTSFQTLTSKAISNSGNWITYQTKPFRGDTWLFIFDNQKNHTYKFTRGKNAIIGPEENFIAFKRSASYDTIFKLKLKHTPKKDYPKDSAYIFITANANTLKYPRVKSIIVPQDSGKSLAILQFTDDSCSNNDKTETYNLLILTPPDTSTLVIKNVAKAQFSYNGKYLVFITIQQDSTKGTESKIFSLNTKNKKIKTLFSTSNEIKNLSISPTGHYIAFTSSSDTVEPLTLSLKLIDLKTKKLITIIDSNSSIIPTNWTISKYKNITFSSDESKIYFGIAPKESKIKDTIPEDEKPKVDIWSWTDSLLMPEQLVELDEAQKHSFLTVYFIKSKRLLQIEKNKYEQAILSKSKNSNYVLIADPSHYLKQRSWDYPWWNDYYVLNLKTGKRILAARKTAIAYLSPSGKYVIWYNFRDSSWRSFITKSQKTIQLTNDSIAIFWDEDNDIPAPAYPYGFAGFDKKEKLIYIYGKFDIWAFSPTRALSGFNLTANYGRTNSLKLRFVNFNKEKNILIPNKLLIKAFNTKTKDAGFYKTASLYTSQKPEKLIYSSHYYYTPILAKNANVLIWQRSKINQYPDLQISDINFKHIKQISHLINQQKDYIWATDTLIKWTTTDGKTEEGILVKPTNFNPNKKYPVIVYYYERNSDYLHRYYFLRPSRSIINPIHYASNGYVVFIPNIRYKTGFPGMSAYNYVISGTLALIGRYPWIDSKHIGLQGQSWGGYETAFIITQTNLFAAAMAGAPVANMTSAYGGIRWGSGLSRMFQYEKTQSRIGGTLWDKLPLYIYNSPVFYAPKIKTPLLIMHNDKDGAVPWYQGIELFVALRRLNKPVWLLNYNGQPHNLKAQTPDCIDLTIRMMQFFDHYLKNKPLPYWMKYGIPATEKGKNLGYQLVR